MTVAAVRLLVVEDDEEDYLLTRKLLLESDRARFVVTWVRDLDAALRALESPCDACLVDYNLGSDTGLELIERAVAAGFAGPLILLTGRMDHDNDVEVMRAGASDYLLKSQISSQLLERVIRHAIERKSTEQALMRSEDKLRQSQKMEAIGSLAGGVAHDFNNILSVILGYSELLSTDLRADDPMRQSLDEIHLAGMRAADLTRQLLSFSRQQVLQPKVIDLNEVVGQMEKMLRRVIGEDVELSWLGAANLRKIVADPGQLEQVIMNLAVNARDAMPRGGKLTIETADVVFDAVSVSQHVDAKLGPHVRLTVTDTGVGMDKATQERMFEPFFTTKEIGKGTGLGLATVFGIVRQSGGLISVSSEPGLGTAFNVFFPPSSRDESGQTLAPIQERRTLSGTETILLVEDDQSVRALTRTILHRHGYNVLEAIGGGDAVLLCEQHPGTIDLLLTDVVMPRMSGRQLAERLLTVRPEMRVLYMSGYTDDATVRHGMLNSTLAFIQKPITPTPLARMVREVLGSRGRVARPS